MATMYELSNELSDLLQLAGSDDPDDIEAFNNTLEGMKYEIGKKADGYLGVIDRLKTRAAMYRKQAARLTSAASLLEKNTERMMSVLKAVVEQLPPDKHGKHVLQSDYYTLKIVNNGGKRPLVIDGDVPQNYMKIIYETDTDKIRKALDAGEKLPFAHYEERGTHLKIS